MLPMVWALFKWRGITLQDFATHFSDPFLRQAFPSIHYDYPEMPVVLTFSFLAGMHKHDLGWPRGGSLAFSQAIEKRYLDLGGEIHYKSRVVKILVENNHAVGIRLADGREHRADIVVSAADGHTTIFDMLEGKYVNEQIRRYYSAAPASEPFTLTVFLGVARDLSREPHAIVLLLDQPVTIAGKVRERLDVELFNFDPSMAPAGKSVIKVVFDSSYTFWKSLYDRYEEYQAEKDRVASSVISLLEKRFPGIKEQTEVIDVATPVTIERYTGNWQGFQVWLPTEKAEVVMRKGLSRTLPGLENFYMVGQWAEAMVGISTAAESGCNLIKTLCKRDKKPFLTKIP
jgi:phytoene dehydrogenase-like protein